MKKVDVFYDVSCSTIYQIIEQNEFLLELFESRGRTNFGGGTTNRLREYSPGIQYRCRRTKMRERIAW